MFVGLAGTGGDTPGPEGSPFSGGPTAGVAAVRDGEVTMLASGLASAVWRNIDWVWGVNDVEILGDQLYALNGGGGLGTGIRSNRVGCTSLPRMARRPWW